MNINKYLPNDHSCLRPLGSQTLTRALHPIHMHISSRRPSVLTPHTHLQHTHTHPSTPHAHSPSLSLVRLHMIDWASPLGRWWSLRWRLGTNIHVMDGRSSTWERSKCTTLVCSAHCAPCPCQIIGVGWKVNEAAINIVRMLAKSFFSCCGRSYLQPDGSRVWGA